MEIESIQNSTLFKENEYKRVELVSDDRGLRVVKTFQGHSPENCKKNAIHTYDSLVMLSQSFSDVLISPRVLGIEGCSVDMEYLHALPEAKQLNLTTLPQVRGFFTRCYELDQNIEHLGTIADSVALTPKSRLLLDSDCPLALGFKGDLYENLRLCNDGLILADSETASLEPLGLSELILYVFLIGSTISRRTISFSIPTPIPPIAFGYLTKERSLDMIDAALEFGAANMRSLLGPIRAWKLNRAKRCLIRVLLMHHEAS